MGFYHYKELMKKLIKEYWLQTYVGKTFLSTAFYKRIYIKKDFLVVADTHTSVWANSYDNAQE